MPRLRPCPPRTSIQRPVGAHPVPRSADGGLQLVRLRHRPACCEHIQHPAEVIEFSLQTGLASLHFIVKVFPCLLVQLVRLLGLRSFTSRAASCWAFRIPSRDIRSAIRPPITWQTDPNWVRVRAGFAPGRRGQCPPPADRRRNADTTPSETAGAYDRYGRFAAPDAPGSRAGPHGSGRDTGTEG